MGKQQASPGGEAALRCVWTQCLGRETGLLGLCHIRSRAQHHGERAPPSDHRKPGCPECRRGPAALLSAVLCSVFQGSLCSDEISRMNYSRR